MSPSRDTLPSPWAASGGAWLPSQSKSVSWYPEWISSLSEPLPLVLLLSGTWLHPLYTVPSTLYKSIQSTLRSNLLWSMPKQSQLSLFLHISPMLQPFNQLSDSSPGLLQYAHVLQLQVLFRKVDFHPDLPQPVLVHGVVPPQAQSFTPVFVELHEIPVFLYPS